MFSGGCEDEGGDVHKKKSVTRAMATEASKSENVQKRAMEEGAEVYVEGTKYRVLETEDGIKHYMWREKVTEDGPTYASAFRVPRGAQEEKLVRAYHALIMDCAEKARERDAERLGSTGLSEESYPLARLLRSV